MQGYSVWDLNQHKHKHPLLPSFGCPTPSVLSACYLLPQVSVSPTHPKSLLRLLRNSSQKGLKEPCPLVSLQDQERKCAYILEMEGKFTEKAESCGRKERKETAEKPSGGHLLVQRDYELGPKSPLTICGRFREVPTEWQAGFLFSFSSSSSLFVSTLHLLF